MVDCLGRSFLFDEASKLIEEFERDHAPEIVMYTCVLSGARNAKNAVIAEKTTRRMQELFPEFKNDLIAADILLANTLASTGDFDKSSSIRWKLSQNGSKKKPGLS